MFWNKVVRVLRKRIVLGMIFAISFVYCFLSIVRESDQIVEADVKPIVRPDLSFRWHSPTDNSNNSNRSVACRNSIQGKVLITDDKGYVCFRSNVLPTGCCDVSVVSTQQYSCETCQNNGCCMIYEYCIACCLHPDKKILLQGILGKASETFSVLFASVTDHFELCLTKCRTSSQSNYDLDEESAAANEKQPFYTADWLEDCYQQLAVPNPHLEKLMEKVAERLAVNVKGQLDNSGKQQALFTLLGRQYVKQHFPHHKYDPTMLEPPKMKSDAKVILLEDMRDWLQQQLVTTCHELGYDKPAAEGMQHAELGPFYRQAESVYKKQLEKRVQEIKAAKAKSRGSSISASKLGLDLDSPSHALGEALLAIGLRDPFKMARILKKMQQRCLPLPMSLRSYVWSDFLFLRDGVKANIVLTNVVKQKLEKFEATVNQHTKEMKLTRSTESSLNKQIDEAVMDAYNNHPSLKRLDSDAHLLEAVHVLNMLYVYNRSFNLMYVFWLSPLQIAIERAKMSETEGRLYLALHLDMFVRHCSLSQSELFTCAQQVMDTLKSLDPYLHEHLGDTASKNVYVKNKDFPVECFHQDKTEAEKIATELGLFSGSDVPESRVSVFSDPAIFVRKWLATGLASVLSPPALLLMWDFFFLGKWDRRRLHDICLVLLGLLKPWFYRAKDYSGIQQVFFEEPGMLYTSDLRKALTHWQDRGAFDDIPNMNHNIINKSATSEGKS